MDKLMGKHFGCFRRDLQKSLAEACKDNITSIDSFSINYDLFHIRYEVAQDKFTIEHKNASIGTRIMLAFGSYVYSLSEEEESLAEELCIEICFAIADLRHEFSATLPNSKK